MSLSACIKCWDTPCCCGWEYRNLSVAARIEKAAVILGVDVSVLVEKLVDEELIPDKHPQLLKR